MTTSRALDLVGVLNALAGTTQLGAAAAANHWAGLPANTHDLLGALCAKAGVAVGQYDFNGVCNKLAGLAPGTLDAVAALNHLLYGSWPV